MKGFSLPLFEDFFFFFLFFPLSVLWEIKMWLVFFTFVAQSQFIKRKCSHSFPFPHPILLWRFPPPIPSHLPLMYSHPLGKGEEAELQQRKRKTDPSYFPKFVGRRGKKSIQIRTAHFDFFLLRV